MATRYHILLFVCSENQNQVIGLVQQALLPTEPILLALGFNTLFLGQSRRNMSVFYTLGDGRGDRRTKSSRSLSVHEVCKANPSHL